MFSSILGMLFSTIVIIISKLGFELQMENALNTEYQFYHHV